MDRWVAMLCSVILLTLVPGLAFASSTEKDFESCENIVLSWRDSAANDGTEASQSNLQNLLFFLHVPRSGGRAFFHCFLRKLFRDLECPCAYDNILRFNPSESNCRLVAGHHDFTKMSKFPREKTSVMTIVRHPLDRVFSSYEMAVDWAARFLIYPNLTSTTQIIEKFRSEWRGISLLDAWPWNYVVPWIREDLFARREARANESVMEEIEDPYNVGEIVMPLSAFINDPLAHEVIHNGATFQVAGLTNNSCLAESHEVRHCVKMHPSLGQYALDVAKKRLEKMFHIALTEKHKESARLLAEVIGAQAISQLQLQIAQAKEVAANNSTESSELFSYSEMEDPSHGKNPIIDIIPREVVFGNDEMPNQNMTVQKLMEGYEECLPRLNEHQAKQRSSALKAIFPVKFSKKARQRVPEGVVQQILSFNSLDIELYEHAQHIFKRRQQQLMQKLGEKESREDSSGYSCPAKSGILVPATLMSLICAFLLVNARRRSSKFKNH